jgi:hypothetical protein
VCRVLLNGMCSNTCSEGSYLLLDIVKECVGGLSSLVTRVSTCNCSACTTSEKVKLTKLAVYVASSLATDAI